MKRILILEMNAIKIMVFKSKFWKLIVLTPFGVFVAALLLYAIIFTFQTRKYFDYQKIQWKSTTGAINQIFYSDIGRGYSIDCRFTFATGSANQVYRRTQGCEKFFLNPLEDSGFSRAQQKFHTEYPINLEKPIRVTVFYNPENVDQVEISRNDLPDPTKPRFPWNQVITTMLVIGGLMLFYYLITLERPENIGPPESSQ
jgi:hypothetical protein